MKIKDYIMYNMICRGVICFSGAQCHQKVSHSPEPPVLQTLCDEIILHEDEDEVQPQLLS